VLLCGLAVAIDQDLLGSRAVMTIAIGAPVW
jgi:hypothetical protein